MSDLIKREDAIKAIHNYWKKRLDTLPTKESEYGEVYADIQQMDKILEHNKILCNFINAIPSADRPNEVIYGNEHNCIMAIFGECSYAETGCGDCAVVEKVRKALSTDRPQGDSVSRQYLLAEIDDLADEFSEVDENGLHSERWCGIIDAKCVIANAPLVADRPQGEWRDLDDNFVPLDEDGCTTASAWCSNCGEWLTGSDEYWTSGRFCPNCGYQMRKE